MADPIDSYRIGGNGMVHFYSGNRHALTAPMSSAQTLGKMRELDAARPDPTADMRAYWRPVVDATTAEPTRPAAFSFSAPPIRPGAGLGGGGAPLPPAAPPPMMAPQGGAPQVMPPPMAAPEGPSVNMDALDDAYRRSMMATGPR